MAFQPMPLSRKPAPFDHPEWVFELKYDGFRSLAIIHSGRCELISRNGHSFNSFTDLHKGLTSPYQRKTVLDGEIVCLLSCPSAVIWRFHPDLMGAGREHQRGGRITHKSFVNVNISTFKVGRDRYGTRSSRGIRQYRWNVDIWVETAEQRKEVLRA